MAKIFLSYKRVSKFIFTTQRCRSDSRNQETYVSPYNSTVRSSVIQKLLPPANEEKLASVDDQILLQTVIRYYQKRGHQEADLDPLGLSRKIKPHIYPPRTIIGATKFPINLNTDYIVPSNTSLGLGQKMKLKDIIELLRKTYCGKMAIEFVYDYNVLTRDWVKEQYEMMDHIQQVTPKDKIAALRKLIEIDIFQKFLDNKFPNTDRYHISGCESAIVALSALVEYAVNMSESKCDTIIIGCERAGRLEILAHVLNKPLRDVISLACPDNELGYFRYQMGTTSEITAGSKSFKICLVSQPSINALYYPIAVGKAAGIQLANFQKDKRQILPIMFHNCTEFESEGIVYETMKQTLNHSFSVDGVIHLIMNHQNMMYRKTDLFTTDTGYCTDVGKTIHSPILHVNGHYMEGILNALQLAIKYRSMFKRDIIIDIVGYQRYPINFEPTCYEEVVWSQAIKKIPPLLDSYSEQLQDEGVVTESEIKKLEEEYTSYLEASSKSSDKLCTQWSERLRWNENILPDRIGRNDKDGYSFDPETGISTNLLEEMSMKMWKIPKNFQLSYKELEMFKDKVEDLHEGKLDWVNCEAVAFASFINEGVAVRLSGMKVNKRRHVLLDPSSRPYNILREALSRSEDYCLCETNDSPCASAALEAGKSSASRDSLILWEAPEADKTGSIQSLLDYLADCAHIYNNNASLIVLIPHFLQGKDVGQISPGRPERILSLAEEDLDVPTFSTGDQLTQANLVIVRPSTPASYFHALRRHHHLPVARPLVIFVPSLSFTRTTPSKQISRAHEIISPTKFKWYLRDIEHRRDSEVEKLVLCTGSIYFDIIEERAKMGMSDEVAVCRLEQLFPFPYSQVSLDTSRYPNANIYWVQEEPWSLGFSSYVIPRIEKATGKGVTFVGQPLTRDSYYTRLSNTALNKILHTIFNN